MDPYAQGRYRPGPPAPAYADGYGAPAAAAAAAYPGYRAPSNPVDYGYTGDYAYPGESARPAGYGRAMDYERPSDLGRPAEYGRLAPPPQAGSVGRGGFPTYDQGPGGRPYDAPMYSRPKLPKLYVAKISANCLGPWLLLKESGIPFELVEVDLTKGDNHTNEFLAMNPLGQVPTYVETDGTVVWESNAIMRFICEKHTVPRHLYPKDVNLRGRIEMGLDWRQTVLYPNIAKLTYPALGFTKDRSRVAEGREALEKDLRILSDFFLRETPFIGGALPCIADYAIGMPLLYLYVTDFRIPPKVREYLENLASKSPSWNEVTEELKRYISRL